MASSSGKSSTQPMQGSGSEGESQQMIMDERKRKRMQSNRESARRSRMRKQKHMDELTAQAADLREKNTQISRSISVTTQHILNFEAQNAVLRAQVAELTQRLESLNEIVNTMSFNDGLLVGEGGGFVDHSCLFGDGFVNSDPWSNSLLYLNQPIVTSADPFF